MNRILNIIIYFLIGGIIVSGGFFVGYFMAMYTR